jgi:hypothetical protein
MHRLDRADDIALQKRSTATAERIRRDPAVLADMLLSPIGGLKAAGRARP